MLTTMTRCALQITVTDESAMAALLRRPRHEDLDFRQPPCWGHLRSLLVFERLSLKRGRYMWEVLCTL
jgi:hypothetical protein